MEVGSIYGSYYETAKSYKGVKKKDNQDVSGTYAGFADKVIEKNSVSPKDMTLQEYKEYFKEKMNGLYTHPSQRNMNDVIDITDAAYRRMQTDPEYEKKILDAIAKNKAVNFGGYIPVIAYTRVDDTWEKCYGYTQGMKENVGYTGSTSAKGADIGHRKKARQKELLEEYLEKRAQVKQFEKKVLDEKIEKQDLSEAKEMELFKKEFYDDLSKITIHKTLNNVAINISEAGFKAMKDNPEYREKILSLLQRDLGSSLAPRNCSGVFTIGATLNEYRGDSWPVGYDSGFYARSKNSFYKKVSEKKDRQKELQEKQFKKRMQIKQFERQLFFEQ